MTKNANFFKSLSKEDTLQVAITRYLKSQFPKLLWLHVPNSGVRTSWERFRMSVLGLKKGAPDLMLFRHRINHDLIEQNYGKDYEFSGLAIELKAGKNRQEPEQIEWQIQLEAEGWIYKVFYEYDPAVKFIDQYMQA